MELDALFLSRLQFAFTVAFHIIFPSFTIGLAAYGVRRRIDRLPFAMTVLLFVIAGAMFVLTLRPFVVPWSVTAQEAAATDAFLSFLLFGGAFALPVIIYTSGVYWVFRGEIRHI